MAAKESAAFDEFRHLDRKVPSDPKAEMQANQGENECEQPSRTGVRKRRKLY
jgi:hypothetical protein